jgi:hypothetical protein
VVVLEEEILFHKPKFIPILRSMICLPAPQPPPQCHNLLSSNIPIARPHNLVSLASLTLTILSTFISLHIILTPLKNLRQEAAAAATAAAAMIDPTDYDSKWMHIGTARKQI